MCGDVGEMLRRVSVPAGTAVWCGGRHGVGVTSCVRVPKGGAPDVSSGKTIGEDGGRGAQGQAGRELEYNI